jgi:hypothetical protein
VFVRTSMHICVYVYVRTYECVFASLCVCVCVCVCVKLWETVQAYHECILVLSGRKWDFEMRERGPRRQLALCAWLQPLTPDQPREEALVLCYRHHVALFQQYHALFKLLICSPYPQKQISVAFYYTLVLMGELHHPSTNNCCCASIE